jgi:hypothetical protein
VFCLLAGCTAARAGHEIQQITSCVGSGPCRAGDQTGNARSRQSSLAVTGSYTVHSRPGRMQQQTLAHKFACVCTHAVAHKVAARSGRTDTVPCCEMECGRRNRRPLRIDGSSFCARPPLVSLPGRRHCPHRAGGVCCWRAPPDPIHGPRALLHKRLRGPCARPWSRGASRC